eukprot:TRINITY_DN1809_c1_g1_i2.p1 TRINITY_DN1809_c1_g1~~TRINITY_DN1809_c1_g1_i2.p1  ORF type:complete len:233 (-),score=16.99 TRINITY_DN1809_c1_g1_i2:1021-1719(-)
MILIWVYALIIISSKVVMKIEGLEVLTPPELSGYYISPPMKRFGKSSFEPFFAQVTMMPPDTTNFSLFGKNMIVFIPAGGAVIGNGLEAKSRKARDAGAIGIIVMSEVPSTVPGFSDIVWNECCPSDVEIPVVEVGLYQSIPWISVLLTSGSNLTVYVNDSDPNMWRDFVAEGPYHIYFGSLWLLVSFSLLIYALSKTYGYYQNRGAQLNTGFVFLLIESFCNLGMLFLKTN